MYKYSKAIFFNFIFLSQFSRYLNNPLVSYSENEGMVHSHL